MRIALDCRAVFPGQGGIGRYAESLARELISIDNGNEYFLFTTPRGKEKIVSHKRVTQICFDAAMIDQRWEQLQLPTILSEYEIDLYHNTCFSLPVVKTVKWTVATIHDVVFRARPDLVDKKLRDYLDHWTEHAIDTADAIITVSEFSQKDIIRYYGADPLKIHIIYNGLNKQMKRVSSSRQNAVRKKYHLPESFILYLGSIEPKKNIDALLDAYRILNNSSQNTCPLVLGGGGGGKRYNLRSVVQSKNLVNKVITLGYVDNKDIPSLLSSAAVFVYPSLYEGFGFPPLEAMACGTATVVSDATCLPEVVGDAALIAKADAPEDLAQKIKSLLEDKDLRREMGKKGLKRAKKFRWENTARKTLSIYNKLMTK